MNETKDGERMTEEDEKDIKRLAEMQANDAEHLKAANELSKDWDWRKSVLAYWAEAYAKPALEWAIKPGHDEPDDYTRLACTQFRADEALDKLNELLSKRKR